jgi:DNA-binding transcriptional regulator YhcF (GntR family)
MEFDKNLPVYWQIIEIVKMRIIRQEYLPGSMVPTVRALAEEFCVTSNTLQRAYVELVREGYLISMRGLGYKVTDEKRKLNKLKESALEERYDKLHQDALKMGISDLDLLKGFDKFLNRDELEK